MVRYWVIWSVRSKAASPSGSETLKKRWLHTQEMSRPTTWTKNFACISPEFFLLCVHSRLFTALTEWLFISFDQTAHPEESFFLKHWPCVYMNLRSRFPFLNVVTAGLNRMQVSCSISLHWRYTGWPECHWTEISTLMLFGQRLSSFYENCLAIWKYDHKTRRPHFQLNTCSQHCMSAIPFPVGTVSVPPHHHRHVWKSRGSYGIRSCQQHWLSEPCPEGWIWYEEKKLFWCLSKPMSVPSCSSIPHFAFFVFFFLLRFSFLLSHDLRESSGGAAFQNGMIFPFLFSGHSPHFPN